MNPLKKVGKAFKAKVLDQSEAEAGVFVLGVVLVVIGLIYVLLG